ncbi:MAG: thiamine-phosphate kinase [Planctomycetota bacterium]
MERRLVRWLERRVRAPRGAIVPLGDDAAVLEPPFPGPVVFSTDQVVGGVHVPAAMSDLAAVGRKAVARSLSDLAAMAARPWLHLASVAVPGHLDEHAVQALLEAMVVRGEALGAPLVGGDISATPGPLVVAVTVVGLMEGRSPWRRSGARPGDLIMVTGELGGSLLGRHLDPQPRIAEALRLASGARVHAAIDISDGLLLDLWRLLEASGVAVRLDLAAIPVSAAARQMAEQSGREALEHALSDGEDYELLLAVPPEEAPRLGGLVPGLSVRVIGAIEEGPPQLRDQTGRPLEPKGYEHLDDATCRRPSHP